jgi:hypothetical protein
VLELIQERLELDLVTLQTAPERFLLNPFIVVEHNTNDLQTDYVTENK